MRFIERNHIQLQHVQNTSKIIVQTNVYIWVFVECMQIFNVCMQILCKILGCIFSKQTSKTLVRVHISVSVKWLRTGRW